MIDDVVILTLGLFIFAWLMLIALGFTFKSFAYFLLSLVVGLFMSFEIYDITADSTLSALFAVIVFLVFIGGINARS